MCSEVNPFAALIEGKDAPIFNVFEDIFGFTLDKHNKQPLMYLEDVSQALGTNLLNSDTLEHALFERLFLPNPRQYLLNNHVNIRDELVEDKVIKYLFYCYCNAVNCTAIDNVCRNLVIALIMRNTVTALKQPDLFDGQDIILQLYTLLKNGDNLPLHFFEDIYKSFCVDNGKHYVIDNRYVLNSVTLR